MMQTRWRESAGTGKELLCHSEDTFGEPGKQEKVEACPDPFPPLSLGRNQSQHLAPLLPPTL